MVGLSRRTLFATITSFLSLTLLIHLNQKNIISLSVVTHMTPTSKLTEPSTWYFPSSPTVNTMGFEWADAERQTPTSVYKSSTIDSPSDIIYQSPSYTYSETASNNYPDIVYQNVGTTQSYDSQPAPIDYIPQYTRIWNSQEEMSDPSSDTIPQMIGSTVNARARTGHRGQAMQSARTQALYSVFDAPAHSRLDSIQAELDALKDPSDLPHRRVAPAPVASRGHPPAKATDAWSWPVPGVCLSSFARARCMRIYQNYRSILWLTKLPSRFHSMRQAPHPHKIR